MAKVERLIEHCRDCRYMIPMVEVGGNTFYVGVCGYSRLAESDVVINHPYEVVLSGSSRDALRDQGGIPESCPLTTFEEVTNG